MLVEVDHGQTAPCGQGGGQGRLAGSGTPDDENALHRSNIAFYRNFWGRYARWYRPVYPLKQATGKNRYLYLPTNATVTMVKQSDLLSRVIDVLADFPSPETVLSLRTTPAEDERLDELSRKNELGKLSYDEQIELEHYRVAEHMVRIAKANAYGRLMKA